jgi:hypothetical protein
MGKDLQVCAPDGSGFMPQSDCKSPGLCKADQGMCSTTVCQAGQKTCEGDTLKQCNPTLDGWDTAMQCDSGMCDQVNKQCDTCTPGQKKCQGQTVMTCNAQGQAYTPTACGSTTPYCAGAGGCVQCTAATASKDCAKPCQQPTCNAAGACENKPNPELDACQFSANSYGGFCRSGTCARAISANGRSTMQQGEALYPGESLVNGPYKFTYQTDGNLVLYNNGTWLWDTLEKSSPSQMPAGELVMQSDGNLVVYNAMGAYLWGAGTQTRGSYLTVQNDGNVCVYDANNAYVWGTGTQGK